MAESTAGRPRFRIRQSTCGWLPRAKNRPKFPWNAVAGAGVADGGPAGPVLAPVCARGMRDGCSVPVPTETAWHRSCPCHPSPPMRRQGRTGGHIGPGRRCRGHAVAADLGRGNRARACGTDRRREAVRDEGFLVLAGSGAPGGRSRGLVRWNRAGWPCRTSLRLAGGSPGHRRDCAFDNACSARLPTTHCPREVEFAPFYVVVVTRMDDG